MIKVNVSQLREIAKDLRAGDKILLSGKVYTARDAAHARMIKSLDSGENLPFDIKDAAIYYAGPTPEKNGLSIGSCGPTTSSRMDVFSPRLLDLGLVAMIGKGERSEAVTEAQIRNGALYLVAIGGAGALYARQIKSCKEIAFFDLGCESVKELELVDLPVVVGIDALGGNLFK